MAGRHAIPGDIDHDSDFNDPWFFYILVISGKSLFTRLCLLSLASGVSLLFSSFFFSVIPLEIINLAMNLSGSMNINVKTYAVSAENYPTEMFDNSIWKREVSENGKFILVQGFTMFSMGNLNLICPASVAKPFKESMHFKLFNADFDNTLRKSLSTAAQDCNVIDGKNIPKWIKEKGKE